MAHPLTQNLILQKTKLTELRFVRKLNCCNVQTNDITILNGTPNLEVCSLSANNIDDLSGLARSFKLKELYLRNNAVKDIRQVLHLAELENLATLNLAGNPVCGASHYRPYVIAAVPSLTRLDDEDISQVERTESEQLFPGLHLERPPSPHENHSSPTRPTSAVAGGPGQSSIFAKSPPPPPPPSGFFATKELQHHGATSNGEHAGAGSPRMDHRVDSFSSLASSFAGGAPPGAAPIERERQRPSSGHLERHFEAPMPPQQHQVIQRQPQPAQQQQQHQQQQAPPPAMVRNGSGLAEAKRREATERRRELAAVAAVKTLLGEMSRSALEDVQGHVSVLLRGAPH